MKSVKRNRRCKDVIASEARQSMDRFVPRDDGINGYMGMNPPASAERLPKLRRRARLAPRAAREVDAENQYLDGHGGMLTAEHKSVKR